MADPGAEVALEADFEAEHKTAITTILKTFLDIIETLKTIYLIYLINAIHTYTSDFYALSLV